MVRNAGRLFLFSLISMMSCLSVFAQSTAQLSGTVRDQSGAVLPGVEVTATQTATGLTRSVVSNETGSYTMPNLPVGPYRLEASLPGFRTYAQTGIVLQVGSNPVISIVLEVGQLTETVEVQADAALVETRNTGVGVVIDNVRIMELPLAGRQVAELILAAGAAVGGGTQNTPRNYPTGWRDPQRSVRQSASTSAVPRCDSGVQSRNQRSTRAIWVPCRRCGERGNEIGHQRFSRRPV